MLILRSPIALTLVITLVVIWCTAVVEIDRSQASQRQLAESSIQFEAQSFARSTQSVIERVNELLLDLRGNWVEHPTQFGALLQRRQSYISDIALQVAVIDRDGYLAFSNLDPSPDRIYLGDRPHFRIHLEGGGDHLYVGAPVIGKVSGRLTLQFTRPIFSHEQFAGVLVVSMPPESLSRFDQTATTADASLSVIARNDGAILTRDPTTSAGLVPETDGAPRGEKRDGPDAFRAAFGTARESGHFERTARQDGIDRIYGFQRIPEYSLICFVGRPLKSAMGPYFDQRNTILLTAATASAFIFLALVLVSRNSSARQLAEREVQRSQEMLRSSIDAIGEAFVIYDADDRLAYCNENYRTLYATSAAAIKIGEKFEDMLRYGLARGQYSEAVGREEDWLKARMAAHLHTNSDRVQRLDSGRWLRVRERRTREGYVVGFRIDITELVEAQHAAESARAIAEEASRAKSAFLANMSHELRTPLNGIIGLSEILARSELSTTQRELLQLLQGCNAQLRTLVADLLDFSALEAGDLELRQQVFSPEALARTLLVEMTGNGRDVAVVRIDVHCDADVPRHVRGDGERLRQVLRQLLDNAQKFTREGDIAIRISVERIIDAGSLLLRFAVQDSGIGIAEADQSRIFQPFTQLDGSSTRRHGGTGIGLSLANGLVHRLGGKIQLESTLGQGSLFSFAIKIETVDEAVIVP